MWVVEKKVPLSLQCQPKLFSEGKENIESDVVYRFINEDTIEFIGPHGELYTTHYKSLKV